MKKRDLIDLLVALLFVGIALFLIAAAVSDVTDEFVKLSFPLFLR